MIKEKDKFNHWEVKKVSSEGILCLCTACNSTEKYVNKSWLVNGRSKSCGCLRKNLKSKSLNKTFQEIKVGDKFNSWEVLEITKKNGLRCRCNACQQTIKIVKRNILLGNRSKSCGCQESKNNSLKEQIRVGDSFGDWIVLETSKSKYFMCECSCGTKRPVSYVDLLHQKSKSCGCKKQELAEKTSLENFGTKHPHQSFEIKDKKKQTLLDRYGVENSFQLIDPLVGSKGELELLDWVQTYYSSAKKTWIGGKEIDIFIPELSLGLEYNGLYWHNETKVDKNYHLDKTKYFESKNIRIIHIFEHEWLERREQTKSFLLSALDKNEHKIGARKCKFLLSDTREEIKKSQTLLESTHLQGKAPNPKFVINVYFEDTLLATATFGKHHRNREEWVLSRFTTETNYTIQGALAKISKIASKHLGSKIISWADYRISQGNGYLKAGWKKEKLLSPDYFYHKGLKITSKQRRQRAIVKTPTYLTEHEHALLDGLFRIYDCGKIRFVFFPKIGHD